MSEVSNLIKSLPKEKRKKLDELLSNVESKIIDKMIHVSIPPNTTFIRAGEEASTVYILFDGMVKATDYQISEIIYDYTWFEPIEVFGAMEFYMGYEQYVTTLITLETCQMLKIPKKIFKEWILNDKELMLNQVRVMMQRLNEQSKKERIFIFLNGRERLIWLFLKIYKEHSKEGKCIVQLTQEELGKYSGINLRSTNRAIHQLSEENPCGTVYY